MHKCTREEHKLYLIDKLVDIYAWWNEYVYTTHPSCLFAENSKKFKNNIYIYTLDKNLNNIPNNHFETLALLVHKMIKKNEEGPS